MDNLIFFSRFGFVAFIYSQNRKCLVTQGEGVTVTSLPGITNRFKMAAASGFVPVKRQLVKSSPQKPFLIGVAGGSASGKVYTVRD